MLNQLPKEQLQKNRGEIAMGTIRTSERQIKKHISQMLPRELEYLGKQIKELIKGKVFYSRHLREKEISFDATYVAEILGAKDVESLIIEYNITEMRDGSIDHRVVLRDNRERLVRLSTPWGESAGMANLCVVVSLDNRRIVTAYWNKVNDNHRSIHWDRYCKELSIC